MTANFLNTSGTNGLIQAQFSLFTTELNTLGSGTAVTSSVNGTSGVFTQSNYSNAEFAGIQFKSGGAFTPVVGQVLVGWFLLSQDGGSTFETVIATGSTTQPAVGRPPDFTIPLYENAAWASGNIRSISGRYIKTPWESHKVVIQNFGASAVALPASGNVISATGLAIQY